MRTIGIKILSKAKRYVVLYPNVTKQEMIAILDSNNESQLMKAHVLKYMGDKNDKSH